MELLKIVKKDNSMELSKLKDFAKFELPEQGAIYKSISLSTERKINNFLDKFIGQVTHDVTTSTMSFRFFQIITLLFQSPMRFLL